MEPNSTLALSRVLKVENRLGIHARPAAMIASLALEFEAAELYLECDGGQANGKSVMELMLLSAGQGTEVSVEVKGEQAETLLGRLEGIFKQKFNED